MKSKANLSNVLVLRSFIGADAHQTLSILIKASELDCQLTH